LAQVPQYPPSWSLISWLRLIVSNQEKITAAIDALNSAITALQSATAADTPPAAA